MTGSTGSTTATILQLAGAVTLLAMLLYGAVLRGSCLEGMTVEAGVLEQADTRNVSFHECDWIEEAVSAKKPAMEMGGM